MLIHLVSLLVAAGNPAADTLPTFATPATRELVLRGMARHRDQDTLVADYQARFRYRLSFGFGKRTWEKVLTAAVEEQEGQVQWQRPNDLKVDIQGRRSESRRAELDLKSIFDRPWFVPRQVGDSVRAFGNDFPSRAALHPLAADGPQWYRYAITDSITVRDPTGAEVHLVAVQVMPVHPGGALVAGTLWLDATSAEVVRFSFRFLGSQIWVEPDSPTHEDSVDARRGNSIISRILSLNADLQYALQDGKYWMPYRQILSGRVEVPFIGNLVIPFESETHFQDYSINTRTPIVFTVPLADSTVDSEGEHGLEVARRDSIRADRRRRSREDEEPDHAGEREWAGRWADGRYEMHRAPDDSLKRYTGWGDSLVMNRDAGDAEQIRKIEGDLASLVDRLPAELTGIPRKGIPLEQFANIVRFNRVQGLSLGLDYRWKPNGWAFTRFDGGARFGFADARPLGHLGLVRDAPGGKLSVIGYRDLLEVDPFSHGRTFANTFNAFFSGHDEGDYYLALGASVSFQQSIWRGTDWTISGGIEQQHSVSAVAHSPVRNLFDGDGHGDFPPNPDVVQGTYLVAATTFEGNMGRSRWMFGGSGLTSITANGVRAFGVWQQKFGDRRGATIRIRGGIASTDDVPQLQFRAGGMESVRGFNYGAERGQAFWSVQTDVTPTKNRYVRPVIFLDAGQAARPADFGDTPVLVGGGVGLSLFDGVVRFDLSHPITPRPGGLRFDLVIRGVR